MQLKVTTVMSKVKYNYVGTLLLLLMFISSCLCFLPVPCRVHKSTHTRSSLGDCTDDSSGKGCAIGVLDSNRSRGCFRKFEDRNEQLESIQILDGYQRRYIDSHVCYVKLGSSRKEKDEIYRTDNSKSSLVSFAKVAFSIILSVFILMGTPGIAMSNDPESSSVISMSGRQRYWESMSSGDINVIRNANEKLLDHAVGTINNLYYDHTGGNDFTREDFYKVWRKLKHAAYSGDTLTGSNVKVSFDNRDDAVEAMRWLVSSLKDPYSKYLSREELQYEITRSDEGFLGAGFFVEALPSSVDGTKLRPSQKNISRELKGKNNSILSISRAENLPKVIAVAPHSPAERSGLLVGDRIVKVGDISFLGCTRDVVSFLISKLSTQVGKPSPEYFGYTPELLIASPVLDNTGLLGYRLSKLKLPTTSLEPYTPYESNEISAQSNNAPIAGGDSICNWQLLYPRHFTLGDGSYESSENGTKVGYIRLTRFSRTSTAGFVNAVAALETLGAHSYIIDVRNNYGGVVQEAMLTATSLLRDSHAPLCYTINSRGGFTPHDAEEYIVDTRYPGYLLSSEKKTVVLDEVREKNPSFFSGDGWAPPSNYASLHEQEIKRSLKTAQSSIQFQDNTKEIAKQKRLVLIMNEGTASSAEIFVSSLRDNGRALALVGSKTYGTRFIILFNLLDSLTIHWLFLI